MWYDSFMPNRALNFVALFALTFFAGPITALGWACGWWLYALHVGAVSYA